MYKQSIIAFSCCVLWACDSEIRIGDPRPSEQSLTFDFSNGAQGWEAAFSDYPTADADIYALVSEVRPLPSDNSENGFFLAGTNRSDDLFMFLKSRFAGLEPNTRYDASIEMTILSNAGEGCVGIGGAPGESVYMKVGFSEAEPEQQDYYLNADKGNQSQGGANANVIGNVAVNGVDCSGTSFGEKTLLTSSTTALSFTTDSDGRMWLFVGTDSGYEGRTEIYYTEIRITVSPI